MAGSRIYSVTQLNQEIKNMLESNPLFANLFVRGEISNYKAHPSGHHYLTLKDEDAAISAVLFRSDAARLRFRLANGMKVVARGRVSSFPKTGQVQLYLADLMPDGAGALHLQFEQLKEKLYLEGLFDPAHKRPLPAYPARVALVTSPSGAAVQDMLRILGRRWPLAAVLLFPAAVQGQRAPGELIRALRAANRDGSADLIVLGRGGGSVEDLWAFNDEALARAIYHSRIPVVSAVGHEPDVTIADFVADLRAPTPSGAAELAVPDQDEVRALLMRLDGRLDAAFRQKTGAARALSRMLDSRLRAQTPAKYLKTRREQVDALAGQLTRAVQNRLDEQRLAAGLAGQKLEQAALQSVARRKDALVHLFGLLDAYSPLKVLGRGYAMALGPDGRAVTDAAALHTGDDLTVCLHKGRALCTVNELVKEKRTNGDQKEDDL